MTNFTIKYCFIFYENSFVLDPEKLTQESIYT